MTRDRCGTPLRPVVWGDETPAHTPLLDLWSTDVRPGWPVVLFAGIGGYGRLSAGIPGRFACGMYAGRKEGRRSHRGEICRFAGAFTGATGLEPATSGV